MKQITIDFETYKEELDEAKENGRQAMQDDVLDLLRLIFVKCDKEDAFWKAHEIFDKQGAKIICDHLGLKGDE